MGSFSNVRGDPFELFGAKDRKSEKFPGQTPKKSIRHSWRLRQASAPAAWHPPVAMMLYYLFADLELGAFPRTGNTQ